VLTYAVERDGPALSRESQENIVPGDYGIYEEGKKTYYTSIFCVIYLTLSDMEQAALPSSIAERALARDKRCVFTGASPTCDPNTLVATWIFPPFLGYTLAEDPWLERMYHDDPASC
ncbi:hypothetical protein BYT27DRAFT_7011455, partial [Phlegmacium glaucopus]